jgi:D-aminopeptidase
MMASVKLGVTAILPHGGNVFQDKVFAGCHVINGFGKSAGLIQVEELGTIETPIILTNTLSVGMAFQGLVRYMLNQNPDIGDTTGSVNPLICECNDGEYLNDIRALNVQEHHVFKAIELADVEFKEGCVGAGTGMSCYKIKGGIGTASRVLPCKDSDYLIGALVMSNQGEKEDLIINGKPVGKALCELDGESDSTGDKGSIIIIIATDLPITERQLKRIAKRATAGLVKTGSYMGHGSGDIAIAFTTANRVAHYETQSAFGMQMFNPNEMDVVFRGAVEVVEEAILNSLFTAETTVGKKGNRRSAIKDYAESLQALGLL